MPRPTEERANRKPTDAETGPPPNDPGPNQSFVEFLMSLDLDGLDLSREPDTGRD